MIKNVLIIGAGASGLIAVKEFSGCSPVFKVVCMEQQAVVGGLWNYSDVITKLDDPVGSKYTAVYKKLRTNLPRQVMSYSDIPFSSHLPSFIHHSDVKEYLWNYAKTHDLCKYIEFNTRVTSVKPKTMIGGEDVWEVESVNVLSKKTATSECDIVIVCNGHFSQAILPKGIKGTNDFEGSIIHSQEYRDPEEYRGKRVLVVGAGPSGVDIVSEICLHADKTWLSHRLAECLALPEEVEQVGEVVQLAGKDAVINTESRVSTRNYASLFDVSDERKKKSSVERLCNVDVVVFCTGFRISVPFLNADCGVAVVSSEVLAPLYKDMICLGRQSLAFIGLQNRIIPFMMFEHQAKFLRLFYEGKIKIPEYGRDLLELVRKDEEVMRSYGLDVDLYRHQFADYQWRYMDELAEMGGFEKSPRWVEKLAREVTVERKKSLFKYKEIEFEMASDGFYVKSQKKFCENEGDS